MINWIKNIFKKKDKQVVPLSPNNWSICTTTGRITFKIPIGNLSSREAEKQLKQLIIFYPYWFSNDKITKIKRILNRIQPEEEK